MGYLLPFICPRDTNANKEPCEAVSLGDNIILHTRNDSCLHGKPGLYEHACGHVSTQAHRTWGPCSCQKGAIPCSDLLHLIALWQHGWVNRDTVYGHVSHHMRVILPFAIHYSDVDMDMVRPGPSGVSAPLVHPPLCSGQLKSAARMERVREAETGMVLGFHFDYDLDSDSSSSILLAVNAIA
ncbi:hypothetical protein PENSUB_3272 [Penicillium subrubescens]|uniref:Uncharacterized protein n=1 Tax=Penicillium subrubescens TaxID=1316194 RepID=A0A1Q5UFJ6_9EURO|nr:hypothetical protein PENSUB_3272 [Penicillium subrubescens]